MRQILTAYMAWLLIVFLPGHTRGQITMGPREGATHAASCCSADSSEPSTPDRPTQRDRANCAVCYWAAGLFTLPVIVFDFSLSERLEQLSLIALQQWGQLVPIRESLGRGPPTRA